MPCVAQLLNPQPQHPIRLCLLPSPVTAPLPPSPPLAPNAQVTISLLQKAMDDSGKHRFLIDGFPRNEENRASFESQVRWLP